jgi:hypothetical protein
MNKFISKFCDFIEASRVNLLCLGVLLLFWSLVGMISSILSLYNVSPIVVTQACLRATETRWNPLCRPPPEPDSKAVVVLPALWLTAAYFLWMTFEEELANFRQFVMESIWGRPPEVPTLLLPDVHYRAHLPTDVLLTMEQELAALMARVSQFGDSDDDSSLEGGVLEEPPNGVLRTRMRVGRRVVRVDRPPRLVPIPRCSCKHGSHLCFSQFYCHEYLQSRCCGVYSPFPS